MEPLLPWARGRAVPAGCKGLCGSWPLSWRAGRQWWPLGHPQTKGTGRAHSWKLCRPPEKQTVPPSWLCVVTITTVLLHCPTASTAPSTACSPWSTAENSAVPRARVSCKSLLWNTQRPQWSCWEASQESRAAGSSQDTVSVALLAQSLHHRNTFLWRWLSFFCAVVIVRLFQYVTALRVITYILNVLTPDL